MPFTPEAQSLMLDALQSSQQQQPPATIVTPAGALGTTFDPSKAREFRVNGDTTKYVYWHRQYAHEYLFLPGGTNGQVWQRYHRDLPEDPLYIKPQETPQETPSMKPGQLFDEEELKTGQAVEIRRIETPQLGQTFDLNKLAVDTVLVVNKLVEVVLAQQEEIERLRTAPPVPAEPPMRLAKLSDGYGDVLDRYESAPVAKRRKKKPA